MTEPRVVDLHEAVPEPPSDLLTLPVLHRRIQARRQWRRRGGAVLSAVVVAAVLIGAHALTTETPRGPQHPRPAAGRPPLHNGLIVFSELSAGPIYSLPNAALFSARSDGTGVRKLTPISGRIEQMAASPDGRKVAYTAETYKPGGWHVAAESVQIMNADGSDNRTVYRCPNSACFSLEWSPVGGRLLINGSTVLEPDGRLTQLCRGGCASGYPISEGTWSPDGQQIAFAAPIPLHLQGGTATVWAIATANADGSNVQLITNRQCSPSSQSDCTYDHAPAWSPSGSRIAFTRVTPTYLQLDQSNVLRPSQPTGVFTVAPDGSNLTELHSCGDNCRVSTLRWSPDGSRLAFAAVAPLMSGQTATSTVGVADVTTRAFSVLAFRTRITVVNENWYAPAVSWAPNETALAVVVQQVGRPGTLYLVRVHHTTLESPTPIRTNAYQPMTWLPATSLGGDTVTTVAPVVSVTGSGTETVQLGEAPTGATRIKLQLTCLTPGLFTFGDGASVRCDQSDAGRDVTTYSLAIAQGQQSTTITAAPNDRWYLAAQYTDDTATPWGVNSDGQTYGVPNSQGTPDLIAAVATNGQQGYVYATQLQAAQPQPTSPQQAATMHPTPVAIPVYKSDGHTVIGEFVIGSGPR